MSKNRGQIVHLWGQNIRKGKNDGVQVINNHEASYGDIFRLKKEVVGGGEAVEKNVQKELVSHQEMRRRGKFLSIYSAMGNGCSWVRKVI